MTEQEFLDKIDIRFLYNNHKIFIHSILLALLRNGNQEESYNSSWTPEETIDETFYNNNVVFANPSMKPSYADVQSAETTIRGLL